MKTKLKSLFVLSLSALLLSSSFAYGVGGDSSGGGNAVVCFNDPAIPTQIRDTKNPFFGDLLDSYIPNVISVEAYDLTQAKLARGWNGKPPVLFEPLPNEAPRDYVERLAKRFEKTVYPLASYLRVGQSRFSDNNVTAQPHGISKVNDIGEVGHIDSTNCVVATLALQYNTGDKFSLHYDARLMNKTEHSEFSRNVLVAHEYLYSFARMNGQKTSRNTRDLLGLMITLDPNITVQQLLDHTYDLGFVDYPKELKFLAAYPNNLAWSIAMISLQEAQTAYKEKVLANKVVLREKILSLQIRVQRLAKEVRKTHQFDDSYSYDDARVSGRESNLQAPGRINALIKRMLALSTLPLPLRLKVKVLAKELNQIEYSYYMPMKFKMLNTFNSKYKDLIQSIPGIPTAEKQRLTQKSFEFINGVYEILFNGQLIYSEKPTTVIAEILTVGDAYLDEARIYDDGQGWRLNVLLTHPDEFKKHAVWKTFRIMSAAFARHVGLDLNYPIPQ